MGRDRVEQADDFGLVVAQKRMPKVVGVYSVPHRELRVVGAGGGGWQDGAYRRSQAGRTAFREEIEDPYRASAGRNVRM
jgi:hypothetical protein